jgi:hypothetical protein
LRSIGTNEGIVLIAIPDAAGKAGRHGVMEIETKIVILGFMPGIHCPAISRRWDDG